MIKNDRQYRLTKAAAERFRTALAQAKSRVEGGVDPRLQSIGHAAMRSQLEELEADIREYERLANGEVKSIRVESLGDLPRAIIQARIAGGLGHKELAERLGLKEQQIQRYESTDYHQASFARMLEIASALNIDISEDLVLPAAIPTSDLLLSQLHTLGMPRQFVMNRLVPRPLAHVPDSKRENEAFVRGTAKMINRVFGWSPSVILGGNEPALNRAAASTARFKLTSNADERFVSVYTVYAHFLALLLLQASERPDKARIPTDPQDARRQIERVYKTVSLGTVLMFCWDLGIPVLPLSDAGAFHGACWRVNGRNVIVLKQRTRSLTRWLFDLLHELFHAGQEPEADNREIVELPETSIERRQSDEEQHASWFAGEVILAGRAEELTSRCVAMARNDIAKLKGAVVRVAEQERVDIAALANYMAFRLSLQGENWWGTAANLQPHVEDPFAVARDLLLSRTDFSKLAPMDRDLLTQALSNSETNT